MEHKHLALREKCPNTEFFWSASSCIQSKHRKIQTIKIPVLDTFSCSVGLVTQLMKQTMRKLVKLYIKVSMIVWKRASCLQKDFFWAQFSRNSEKRLYILCIAGLENIYASEHYLNQSVKVLPQIPSVRIWCSSRKFGHKINLKGFLFRTIRLKSFTFLVPFFL